jgi:hypothetical protein
MHTIVIAVGDFIWMIDSCAVVFTALIEVIATFPSTMPDWRFPRGVPTETTMATESGGFGVVVAVSV